MLWWSTKSPAPTQDPSEDVLRLELQQAIESYRLILTLTVQVTAALLAGDITLIAATIITGSPIPVLIGAGIPGVLVALWRRAQWAVAPFAFTAVELEERLNLPEGLITTLLRAVGGDQAIPRFREAMKLPRDSKKFRGEMRKCAVVVPMIASGKSIHFLVIATGAVQLLMAVGYSAQFWIAVGRLLGR